MNKTLLTLIAALFMLSSCRTSEKVLYFQDVQAGENIVSQVKSDIKFQPGDKLTIVITSSKPELAMPFNLPIVTTQVGSVSTRASSNQVGVYTIDQNGDVDIPTLGKVHIAGLTRAEISEKVQSMIREQGLLTDAVAVVSAYDQFVTIMGEVKSPGKITMNHDNLTILEAIGLAGDLNIQARRDRIVVFRQEGAETKPYYVDIRSKDIFNSPVYNLRQNDIIYVEPNKVRTGQSTVNDNNIRAISTWLSISSFLTSLAILIFRN